MKEIQLTQGKFALVDDEDFERLNQWKWFTHKDGDNFYAYRNSLTVNGKRTCIIMHREILGLAKGDTKILVDHINLIGTDNRRENLRTCTNAENLQNKRRYKNCKSQYKGVHVRDRMRFKKTTDEWVIDKNIRARIRLNGVLIHIGSFKTELEAAHAYNLKAIELFGVFANLNKV